MLSSTITFSRNSRVMVLAVIYSEVVYLNVVLLYIRCLLNVYLCQSLRVDRRTFTVTTSALQIVFSKVEFFLQYYKNQTIGDFFVDLYVEDKIVVELKSVENLVKQHEVQLVNYLQGMQKDIGLLIPEFCTNRRISYARHLRAKP